jgi:hypothetical protein
MLWEVKKLMKKTISTLVIAVLLISAFAGLATMQKAAAWGVYHDVTAYPNGQDTTFQRVYCYYWDGYFGIPAMTAAYHDSAVMQGDDYISANCFFGHVDVRLYRDCYVYDESGNLVAASGDVWMQSHNIDLVYTMDGFDVNFYFVDALYIGDNQGLNYYFSSAPQAFAGYKWVVSYYVYIAAYNAANTLMQSDMYSSVNIIHDERVSTNNQYNWELCPECTSRYSDYVSWTNTYGAAWINDASNVVGSYPDYWYAQMGATGQSSHAFISAHMNSAAFGQVWVKCQSLSSQTDFLVYVSFDDSNWVFLGEQAIGYTSGAQWVNCGGSTSGYNYVLLVVHNSGSIQFSEINIDCIQTGVQP